MGISCLLWNTYKKIIAVIFGVNGGLPLHVYLSPIMSVLGPFFLVAKKPRILIFDNCWHISESNTVKYNMMILEKSGSFAQHVPSPRHAQRLIHAQYYIQFPVQSSTTSSPLGSSSSSFIAHRPSILLLFLFGGFIQISTFVELFLLWSFTS